MRRIFIDCYVQSLPPLPAVDAIVAVDVIRATTTAATAIALGRRCFPAADIEDALAIASRLAEPLLVGELGGNMPYGFDLNNSPASLSRRQDAPRPIILLSTSGTGLMQEVQRFEAGYVACMRNHSATADHLADRGADVVLLGAATRGEFREEDRICCARIAAHLLDRGFEAVGDTADLVRTWKDAPLDSILTGKSARYLRDTGQDEDLQFVLDHVDDLDTVYQMTEGELSDVKAGTATPLRRPGLPMPS
jgi:2-phosphosulfolactate phosphatase